MLDQIIAAIDAVGRFVWRVPSPRKMQAWTDAELTAYCIRRASNPWAMDALEEELTRRDTLRAAERKIAERKRRVRNRSLAERMEYQDVVEAMYLAADAACRGVLVNNRARAAGIDGRWLFSGPEAYARKHASRELLDWWESHPRLTFAAWKAGQREPEHDPTDPRCVPAGQAG